jgi:transcriptional regulator with XRE-family HTH domain
MLGDELRKARQAANFTQEKLSFEAGLDRTYISHLEHDKKSPTVDVLFRICRALGISASELISRVERAERAAPKKTKKGARASS